MKKLFLLTISASLLSLSLAAQPTKKVVIKTPEAQCENCKVILENYLKREPGVQVVNVDIKKKTTTITYITDRNDIEQLKAAIANAGFDADEVTAEESTYKRLPPCCKKAEKPATAPAQ